MVRCLGSLALLTAVLLSIGCSSGPKVEPTAKVSGTVNLDGKPMNDGEISFVGEPGTIPDILPVNAGAFEGSVKLGKKRVEIRAYRAGKPPPTATEPAGEIKENYLPDRFNDNSTLTAEVTASGVSPNKFEVQSK
jgi:hypothetical protein